MVLDGIINNKHVQNVKGLMDDHVSNNLMEFGGCAMLALVCHSTPTNTWKYAMAFAVVCVLHKTQFDNKFHGNPAFTFATWLSKGSMSCFDVFKQVMFQIFGYAFGFWFGGVIGLDAHVSTDTPAPFASMIFNEVISVGIMTWLYLHVNDDNQNKAWSDFMGFAIGAVVWFGYQLKLSGAHMNSAIFAGEDFGKSIAAWNSPSWGLNDFALFFAPLVSVFITSLVYTFYHKK